MTGVRRARDPKEVLDEAESRLDSLPSRGVTHGLSPHAPYSTTPALLRLAAEAGRERRRPISMHVAESAEEFEMYLYRRGPMFDWMKNQRDMTDTGLGSPVQVAEQSGLLSERF